MVGRFVGPLAGVGEPGLCAHGNRLEIGRLEVAVCHSRVAAVELLTNRAALPVTRAIARYVEDLLHEGSHKVLVRLLVHGGLEPLAELVDLVHLANDGGEGLLGLVDAEPLAEVAVEQLDVLVLVGLDVVPLVGRQAGTRGVEQTDQDEHLDVPLVRVEDVAQSSRDIDGQVVDLLAVDSLEGLGREGRVVRGGLHERVGLAVVRVDAVDLKQRHHAVLEQHDHQLVVHVVEVDDQLEEVDDAAYGQLRQVDCCVDVLGMLRQALSADQANGVAVGSRHVLDELGVVLGHRVLNGGQRPTASAAAAGRRVWRGAVGRARLGRGLSCGQAQLLAATSRSFCWQLGQRLLLLLLLLRVLERFEDELLEVVLELVLAAAAAAVVVVVVVVFVAVVVLVLVKPLLARCSALPLMRLLLVDTWRAPSFRR